MANPKSDETKTTDSAPAAPKEEPQPQETLPTYAGFIPGASYVLGAGDGEIDFTATESGTYNPKDEIEQRAIVAAGFKAQDKE